MAKTEQKDMPMRNGFGEALLELGKTNPKVLALTGDLGSSVKMTDFAAEYPDRFLDVGIAEQNMAGVAVGLSQSGFIPFTGTFSCFQPMRNLDQIRTSVCMMNANVKLVSSHGGFSFPGDGIQIQALEDIAIMRVLPNMRVVVPADAEQTKQAALDAAEIEGPVYIRMGRAATPQIKGHELVDEQVFTEFEFGKAQMLRAGSDGTIIACGYMVDRALQAAAMLSKLGIHLTVLNMHTIKPLDIEGVMEAVSHSPHVITIEEHQRAGGLSSAVAELLVQYAPQTHQLILGVDDDFGETAQTQEELWQSRGLGLDNIINQVKQFIS